MPCKRNGCPGKKGDLLPLVSWEMAVPSFHHPPPWELIVDVTPLFFSNWMLFPKQLPRCFQEDFTIAKKKKKPKSKTIP